MFEQRNYLFNKCILIKLILICSLLTGCTINKHGLFIGSESQKQYRQILKEQQNNANMTYEVQ